MDDLRSGFQALVQDPPAPPPSVDEVVERAESIRRRRGRTRTVGLGAVVVLILAGSLAGSRSTRPTELVVAGGGSSHAGYIATAPGGYRGSGDWELTITRGEKTIVLRGGQAPACLPVGFIRPGDEVRGFVEGEGSTLAAGENAGC